jgi:hypothetical protein
MMLEADKGEILKLVAALQHVDAAIVRALSAACVVIKDEEAAAILLERLRQHRELSLDTNSMYSVDYFLNYVKDLVELSEGFKAVPPLYDLHMKAKNTYEVLLYNLPVLYTILENIKTEDRLDAMRENYWRN